MLQVSTFTHVSLYLLTPLLSPFIWLIAVHPERPECYLLLEDPQPLPRSFPGAPRWPVNYVEIYIPLSLTDQRVTLRIRSGLA